MSLEDRVAELEGTVTELRATVDGLTEELVETRERLRQQEGGGDVSRTATESPESAAGDAEFVSSSDAEPTTVTGTDTSGNETGDGQSPGVDGTRAAVTDDAPEERAEAGSGEQASEADATATAEDDQATGNGADDHADPASEDDIIVA